MVGIFAKPGLLFVSHAGFNLSADGFRKMKKEKKSRSKNLNRGAFLKENNCLTMRSGSFIMTKFKGNSTGYFNKNSLSMANSG